MCLEQSRGHLCCSFSVHAPPALLDPTCKCTVVVVVVVVVVAAAAAAVILAALSDPTRNFSLCSASCV